MNIALSLIPLFIQELPGIINAWNNTPTNGHYAVFLNGLAAPVGKFIADVGSALFPKAAPELQLLGGSLAAFNTNYVKLVQGQINVLAPTIGVKLDPLIVDGIYGAHTIAAVEAIQAHFGISVDGIAGNITQGFIAHALATLPQVQ